MFGAGSIQLALVESTVRGWFARSTEDAGLRKSLQSRLRQTLLRLVTVLHTSEVGTWKFLSDTKRGPRGMPLVLER